MGILNINDFKYDLPQERIALYPLAARDQSKLLVYQKGAISHNHFHQLPDFLPSNTFLFFNNTKVIPARIYFRKETGADIEIFLLTPLQPSAVLAETMSATKQCAWKCTVGNMKRWNEGAVLNKNIGNGSFSAKLINRVAGIVQFNWSSGDSFAEIISALGETPLPPYLKRKAEVTDRERYQTIYSHYEGAVAAPTAGLHFTEDVFKALSQKNIHHDFLTLHVSAGTFQPVKSDNAEDHVMHAEQIVITRKNIEHLLVPGRFIVPVGTTSMRTLESIYWFGVKVLEDPTSAITVKQNDPYLQYTKIPSATEALTAVKNYIEARNEETLTGETAIFIKPGYEFKICNGLITNFHQPASTLMLLVAAFLGNDWRKVYDEALQKDYRFLSYGDSSLLIP